MIHYNETPLLKNTLGIHRLDVYLWSTVLVSLLLRLPSRNQPGGSVRMMV